MYFRIYKRLRQVLKELDELEEEFEIPRARQQLQDAMNSLLATNHRYGNSDTTNVVDDLQKKTKLAMAESRDVRIIEHLTDDIRGFEFWGILWEDLGFLVGGIKYYDDNFSSMQWKNSIMAKKLINEAKHGIATNPSKKELQKILSSIHELLPEGVGRYMERLDPSILRGYF